MAFINPNKAGLALAAFFGAWHLLWSVLVALGWAQVLIDFVFWIHFIKPVYVIDIFSPGRALLLIAITSAVGYLFGCTFAFLWNRFHR